MSDWHRYEPAERRLTLSVHVQPNAASSAVAGMHGDALKIRIQAPAVDDKANRALIDFLHTVLGVRNSQIRIRRGAQARRKTVEISEADAALLQRLRALVNP